MLDCLTCRDGASFREDERRNSGLVGRRRSVRLYHQIGAPDLGAFVVTWPGARQLDQAQVAALRRGAHDVIEAYFRHWYGVSVGVHSYVHPCGDKTQGWRPHVHLQVPLVGLTKDGSLRPLPSVQTPEQLETLRSLCARLQAREGLTGAANVHYSFRSDAAEKLHRLSYDGRTFPAWYAGDMARSLRIGRRSGLLAPRCRADGLDDWKAAVSRDETPEPKTPEDRVERIRLGLQCYACTERPQLDAIIRRDEWSTENDGPIVDAYGYHPSSDEVAACEDPIMVADRLEDMPDVRCRTPDDWIPY